MSSPNPLSPHIAIIEPVWTHYRYPVYSELAQHGRVDWLFSPAHREAGFGGVAAPSNPALRYIELPMRKPFGPELGFWQAGVVRYLMKERPDVIMISANPRSAGFWTALLAGRILQIPVYAHGHGVHRRKNVSWPYRRMMILLLRLVSGYIAYGPVVRDGFAARGFPTRKVEVAHNSLINPCPLAPQEKTGAERGVLFLGRLRRDCGIETLLAAAHRLRDGGHGLEVHIVGEGELLGRLRKLYGGSDWVHCYGEVYDPAQIREISQECFAGCHPGMAGLSVVHMMSLSLPVLVRNGLERHGPEVALVQDQCNGIRYGPGQRVTEVGEALSRLLGNVSELHAMQAAAYACYRELITPSLATQLGRILLPPQFRGGAPEPSEAANATAAGESELATNAAREDSMDAVIDKAMDLAAK